MKHTKTLTTRTQQPLVSVLIPVYNGTEYLDAAIESVLKSTYKKIEIVLVDDGSTDESQQKCLDYQKKYRNIHFYGFRKNKGMTRCLNFGVQKAKGKYIARINQDDIMMPRRIEQQVKFLEKNEDYVVVGGTVQLFTETQSKFDIIRFPLSDELIRAQWMMLSPYADPAVMYRKDAWLQTEGYSQYFWPADDVHMWYQLGKIGKMANLPQVMTLVRWHEKCGSIQSHRRQMLKTYQVHEWASEFIAKPTLFERLFWISQLMAGYFLPAQFNWWVYRQLRRLELRVLGLFVKKVSDKVSDRVNLISQRVSVNFS
jgi:glycosyltransferase involved in cell wall biosynthesis